ncbi:NFACT RNA binding domain-containing protein [Pseudodesulfovibrio pelocollis]|uniref:NFACT RNA binding domain-containing protein n=1 Tax=Pseudodesulfovibrio pelocollis TaxID=3051432 RepID=UPI00255B0322|nr:NFACT RNA binding domain-containing protein [Pseudodesulfovibrio sp. SB368]
MEANFFRFLAAELGQLLHGRRIDKVFAPAPGVWTLTIQNTGEPLHLLFRPARSAGLLFLSPIKPPNPQDAPAQAMWFRKRLRNRKIIGWTADWPTLRLALTLTPRHDPPGGTHLVLDLREGMRLADELEPGFGAEPEWPAISDVLDDPDIWRDAPQISPLLRRALADLPGDEAHRLYLDTASGATPCFHLPAGPDAPPLVWPSGPDDERFDSALEAANAHGQRTLFPLLEMEAERPEQVQLKRERKKIKRNLARLDEEETRLHALASEKILAEALQAELYRFKDARSLDEVPTTHPEHGPITVPLNPHLSPTENMALYFKRAAKAERGFPHVRRRRAELLDQLDRLERGELRPAPGSDHPDIPLPGGPAPLPKRYRGLAVSVFRSSDGFTLVRGKNKRANHDMLGRAASPFDYWFHLADGPSSHVILKRDHPAQEVPEQTLIEAARLCAIKSHSRSDGKAEVMYALIKDVRKVKGLSHGQVLVDKRLGTLRVDLDPDIETALSR